ncbi:hypothetical protein Tco_0692526, partial [Tanacetum coccineum]
ACRSTATPRGGRTGGRTSRGGGRTREPTSRVSRQTSDQDGQGGDRGNRANGGIDAVPDFSMVIAQGVLLVFSLRVLIVGIYPGGSHF